MVAKHKLVEQNENTQESPMKAKKIKLNHEMDESDILDQNNDSDDHNEGSDHDEETGKDFVSLKKVLSYLILGLDRWMVLDLLIALNYSILCVINDYPQSLERISIF